MTRRKSGSRAGPEPNGRKATATRRRGADALVAVAVRLTSDVVAAVDDVAADLSRAASGLRVSRSDVVRVLIGEALAARSTKRPRG